MDKIKTSDVVEMVEAGLKAHPAFVRCGSTGEMGETYITVILKESDRTQVSVRIIVECPEAL